MAHVGDNYYPCDVYINTSTNQQTHHFMSIFLYIK
jgi:hypothetical protein